MPTGYNERHSYKVTRRKQHHPESSNVASLLQHATSRVPVIVASLYAHAVRYEIVPNTAKMDIRGGRMPVEGPLPQTGDAQDIGADAARCFVARIPRNWRPHSLEGTDDYGLDFQIQTTPGQRATDVFRVQLKGTRSPVLSADGSFLSIALKASTVRFYDRIVEPILLVVCDLSADPEPVDCPLYYAWVRDELRRISVSDLDPAQESVTMRVPVANRLRSTTDLSRDIDAQNELARAGHALGETVERTHAGMLVEERVGFVQRMASGIDQRGTSFIDALAAPVDQHWIEPTAGSLAWHLRQANLHLKTGLLDRAEAELVQAEYLLPGTELEVGEYWFLSGKWLSAKKADEQASESFQKAYKASRLGKYVAAYAESELRRRFQETGPAKPYPDLLELLVGEDAMVLSARSRVLAAEGKLEEAIATADRIEGVERYAARSIAHTMFGKSSEAVADCYAGLAVSDLPDNTRQVLLVVKARSKFALCQAGALADEGGLIPPSGSAGIDGSLVKDAWAAIEDALAALRDTGWGNNVDLIADIWAATASILAKQRIVLPELAVVAKLRQNYPNLQLACETIAAQCGDFSTALEANKRQPASDMKNLRRALLLHEAGRHGECCNWFDTHFDGLNRGHALFGQATTAAAISAHKLAKPELVRKWSAELESNAQLVEHAAFLHYLIATQVNSIDNEAALERLVARYEELARPFFLSIVLLQELNPTIESQARLCIQVAERARETAEPSPTIATHVGMALATLKSWDPLLKWCEAFRTRVDAWPKMQAFEALALDRLGRTPEARALLEGMLAGGVLDSLALNTYIAIMVRCGYVEEAINAAERIMESATDDRRRIECTRLLFSLIQQSDPGSSRLLALALQMGRLVSPDVEIEEGIYLVMFLTATLNERVEPLLSDFEEYRRRAEAFFDKFPNSGIIKKAQFRDDATGSEILATIKKIAGITEDREAFKLKMENQMQRGQTVVPFAWRPRLILTTVGDVVHLWEIAKRSSVDDKKYHLTMLSDREWSPPSANSLRERPPLIDMTALMVIFDLGLLDAVVAFFGKIAIAKSTLEALAGFVNPFSGSLARAKCVSLQDALKRHLGAIEQPSIVDLSESEENVQDGPQDATSVEKSNDWIYGREHRELVQLSQKGGRYRLFSDDLAFRILTARSDQPDGICTLDVLAALQEVGLITRQESAEKVALLCAWRVGLVVRMDVITSLLPDGLATSSTAKAGMEMLDGRESLKAVLDAVWDFRSPFNQMLGHAAAVVSGMADSGAFSGDTLAAFLGQWLVKAAMKSDAPPSRLQVLVKVIIAVVVHRPLSDVAAGKLWRAYLRLIEFHHGNLMDEKREAEAIELLGRECASIYEQNAVLGETLQSSLRCGLTAGTSDEEHFAKGYTEMLQQLAFSSAQSK